MSSYVELGRGSRGMGPARGFQVSDRHRRQRRSRFPTVLAFVALIFGVGLLLGRLDTPRPGPQTYVQDAGPFHYFPR